jgi:hypothetical protein
MNAHPLSSAQRRQWYMAQLFLGQPLLQGHDDCKDPDSSRPDRDRRRVEGSRALRLDAQDTPCPVRVYRLAGRWRCDAIGSLPPLPRDNPIDQGLQSEVNAAFAASVCLASRSASTRVRCFQPFFCCSPKTIGEQDDFLLLGGRSPLLSQRLWRIQNDRSVRLQLTKVSTAMALGGMAALVWVAALCSDRNLHSAARRARVSQALSRRRRRLFPRKDFRNAR